MEELLRWLLSLCHDLTGNLVVAIFLFTALTKVILFPVSLWTQRNVIRLVELTPELNQLKTKYHGDKNTIAEKTRTLYKNWHYHPIVDTVPLIIQLALLIAVISLLNDLLKGTDSWLGSYPYQRGGATLLLPIAAGFSALLLGLAQNHLNPLQREQSPTSQWLTNGLSIVISLFLGVFVPVGVGFYWIASNLFSIIQQWVLNVVMPSQKYVDYESLKKSQTELQSLERLSSDITKEDRKRERTDYKRFFSIANKHIVFYSEKSGYYKYFQDVIEYLLSHSNLVIHYVTSDPKDQIFTVSDKNPRIRSYFIGEKRLITLMMKMDADMVVMTMTDLGNYHIKRSYVRKDIEYVYIFHAMVSTHMIYRKGSFDHYDTIFCVGPHHMREIREAEIMYGLPQKTLVEFGYPLLDDLLLEYNKNKKVNTIPLILIAPSHHKGNIMDSCLDTVLSLLHGHGWTVIVRPHPQHVRRNREKIKTLQDAYAKYTDIKFEVDFSSNSNIYSADILITDWSGISLEYSFVTRRPCLFINTPMKVLNPDWTRYKSKPMQLEVREKIGVSFNPDHLQKLTSTIKDMLDDRVLPADEITEIVKRYVYNIGSSAEIGGRWILERLIEKQKRIRREE